MLSPHERGGGLEARRAGRSPGEEHAADRRRLRPLRRQVQQPRLRGQLGGGPGGQRGRNLLQETLKPPLLLLPERRLRLLRIRVSRGLRGRRRRLAARLRRRSLGRRLGLFQQPRRGGVAWGGGGGGARVCQRAARGAQRQACLCAPEERLGRARL